MKVQLKPVKLMLSDRKTPNQGINWIREPVMLIAYAMNKPEPLTSYAGC